MFKEGLANGLSVTWLLIKAVVPAYFAVTFLKYSSLFGRISDTFEPAMRYLGLPGEASLPFALGNFINLYPALGAIEALQMDGAQVTLIAFMLLLSHSVFIESVVIKSVGVRVVPIVLLRLTAAFLAALLFHYFLQVL